MLRPGAYSKRVNAPQVFPKTFTFVPPPERPERPERPEASLKRILNERIRQPNWMGANVRIGPLGINVVISHVVPRDAIYFGIPDGSSGLMSIPITVDDDQIAPRSTPGATSRTVQTPVIPSFQMSNPASVTPMGGLSEFGPSPIQRMRDMGLNIEEERRHLEQETRFVEGEILRGIGVTTIPAGTIVRKKEKLSPVEVWHA